MTPLIGISWSNLLLSAEEKFDAWFDWTEGIEAKWRWNAGRKGNDSGNWSK